MIDRCSYRLYDILNKWAFKHFLKTGSVIDVIQMIEKRNKKDITQRHEARQRNMPGTTPNTAKNDSVM